MTKYRENELLDVLKGTLGEFEKEGVEASLHYKDGCLTATVRTKVCMECEQIHDGPCPKKQSPWE